MIARDVEALLDGELREAVHAVIAFAKDLELATRGLPSHDGRIGAERLGQCHHRRRDLLIDRGQILLLSCSC